MNLIPEAQSPIQMAIRNLEHDAGALYAPAVLEQLREMRSKDPAAFARLRLQVKATKHLSMVEFDRLTAGSKDDAAPEAAIFPEVEAWPDLVDGADLLDDITHALARHVVADKETLRAAALWSAFTWLVDAVQVAPIANITAPEKRCGKSILLTALGKLAYRPLQVSNIAPAALFRSIELWAPTLLIDEVDAFLAAHEDARGILNSGFTRDSATVIRCVGDDHTPTPFNVWGAKALCGIGKIADTLADRSVPLRLRRRTAGETVESLRHSDPTLWEQLRARLARFALDSASTIATARPAPIPGLNDRANDAWEPLLSIADLAGEHWPKSARHAAIALHGLEGESPSVGAELLADVKAVFDAKNANRIFSADLLTALLADDESPWATWNRGKAMTPRQLVSKLADFGIKSKDVRQGAEVKKGYHLEQFTDAFIRYLSADSPAQSATPLQPSNHAGYSVAESATDTPAKTPSATRKATARGACSGVADRTPPIREKEEQGALFGGVL
ncbi:DUF3631 domain-containing protein [Pseudomonas sp. 5Ae-yellow]|uniref:DUF3631 domain-containing protein n=1 Tax=Pseudomonas sp. 5Ae-yellow TaxID=2759848 RepID=UPI000C9196C8|nr:DUF3631 domain-containing protein [Pseudomonas sp. 5Ae-yellow]MAB23138.1 hypothetical protein [Pseudomonadales bacterium]MBA6421193.1 DUF3631 domain-containing protein [Pseudomonas sp. 5Ae-yellow]|tara:strand:+ start:1539 stop:3053 length:1515 start_codon:yes stop_codon:yes gene_type:complete